MRCTYEVYHFKNRFKTFPTASKGSVTRPMVSEHTYDVAAGAPSEMAVAPHSEQAQLFAISFGWCSRHFPSFSSGFPWNFIDFHFFSWFFLGFPPLSTASHLFFKRPTSSTCPASPPSAAKKPPRRAVSCSSSTTCGSSRP